MESSTEASAKTPQLKRRCLRQTRLDFSKLTDAPKKPKEEDRGLRNECMGDDQPQGVKQRLTYDQSAEPVPRLKSDERGATITIGSKWIQLSRNGFVALKNVRSLIDADIENKVSDTIRLQDEIYVNTAFFANTWAVDIRKHVPNPQGDPRPTRFGVRLTIPMWNKLKGMMDEHSCEDTLKDSFLGRVTITVLGQFMAYNLQKYEEIQCEGCVHDWPSQRDHECLMNNDFIPTREQNRTEYLKSVKNEVDIHWFTMQLVSRCVHQQIELTRVPRYLLYKAIDEWSDELLKEADKWRTEFMEDVGENEGVSDVDEDEGVSDVKN